MNIKKTTIGVITGVGMLLATMTPAFADTVSVNFDNYNLGSISGQDGWSNAVSPNVDQSVVTNTTGISSFGTQSFRISDAYQDEAFGDWVFAKPLTNAVGETGSTDGSFSPGTLQSHFEMQFDITSASPTAQQPGLHVSVSPDRGDGSRMSYLRFEDQSDGIHVFFDDVTDPGPVGTVATFNESDIATISRNTSHTIKLTMDTLNGPSNDVVKVYVDGVLKKTGTSWENYYRYDPEASAEQSPRIVKTVIFQSRGSINNPADQGKGFLFDNFSMNSGQSAPNVTVTIAKYLNGSLATATSANNASFPMTATWNAANIGAGTGTYALGPTGFNNPNPYQATTADMTQGASYTTSEITGNNANVLPIGATCQTGKTRLVGYSMGDTLAAAAAASTSSTPPSFTNLTTNKFVIVRNESCTNPPASFAQCEKGGWKKFNNPPFRNEAACDTYVVAHLHKTQGNVSYSTNPTNTAQWNIANDGSGLDRAVGAFANTDTHHGFYVAKAKYLNVSGNMAWFAGPVTSTNNSSIKHDWIVVEVNNNPDKIGITFVPNKATAQSDVQNMTPLTLNSVTKGNLTVN